MQELAGFGVVAVVEPGGLEALEQRSARSKWTLWRRRMAAWPSAVATNVLPTPTR